MGYFEPDGERMRKVLCLRNDVWNVSWIVEMPVKWVKIVWERYLRNIRYSYSAENGCHALDGLPDALRGDPCIPSVECVGA